MNVTQGALRGEFHHVLEIRLRAVGVTFVESSGRAKQIPFSSGRGNLLELITDGFECIPIATLSRDDPQGSPGFGQIRAQPYSFPPLAFRLSGIALFLESKTKLIMAR